MTMRIVKDASNIFDHIFDWKNDFLWKNRLQKEKTYRIGNHSKLKATKDSLALLPLRGRSMPLPLKLSGLCDCFNSWIIVHVILCQSLSPCPRDWQLYFVSWNTCSWNLKLHIRSITTLVYCTVRKPKPCGGIMKDEAIWTIMEIERERGDTERHRKKTMYERAEAILGIDHSTQTPQLMVFASLWLFSPVHPFSIPVFPFFIIFSVPFLLFLSLFFTSKY